MKCGSSEENFKIVLPLQLVCFFNRRVHILTFLCAKYQFAFTLFFRIGTLQGSETVLKATELCSCFGYSPAGCRFTLILNGLLRLEMPGCIVVVPSRSPGSGPGNLCIQEFEFDKSNQNFSAPQIYTGLLLTPHIQLQYHQLYKMMILNTLLSLWEYTHPSGSTEHV